MDCTQAGMSDTEDTKGRAAADLRMSMAQFLDWEAAQAQRHEFVAGEVFPMAGADDAHVTVALNVAMALRRHLAGTPCRVYMSDMKLAVRESQGVYYPDVMVTCSEADRASALVKSEPKLLVEVLSPSTAAFDRGDKFAGDKFADDKFADYRRLASLQEYALVDPKTRRSDVYRKGADDLWVLHPADAGQSLVLSSVALEIDAQTLFAEVDARDQRAAR